MILQRHGWKRALFLALGMLRADAQGSGKSFSCEGPGAVADNGNPFLTCKGYTLLSCSSAVRQLPCFHTAPSYLLANAGHC